ncbi:hypothetical protein SteCoe_24417 [Stentor coeruleus]|uniref:Uncharacterized protein n=1 Tax=Stentor coeruleus TaxID=5963 RepID=A0A1R2BHM3_9CILI|nr:hypothetical protein SteCoe_24417 [Stentor coeruleus]
MGCNRSKVRPAIEKKKNKFGSQFKDDKDNPEKDEEGNEEGHEAPEKADAEVGLAYELVQTPRGETGEIVSVYKNTEKNKKSILLLKSFTLERSIQKVNVLQTRNYLKKPYMKEEGASFSSSKRNTIKDGVRNKPSITYYDELDNVTEIFEKQNANIGKKDNSTSGKKFASFKLCRVKNSLNNGFNHANIPDE